MVGIHPQSDFRPLGVSVGVTSMSEHQGLNASPSEWPKALFYTALLFSTYQIITAAFHPVSSQVLRAGHVGFLLLMVYLCYPARGAGRRGSRWPGCWASPGWPHSPTNGISKLI